MSHQDPTAIDIINAKLRGMDSPAPVKAPKPKPVAPVMTEPMREAREKLRALLKTGRWLITFKKVDGALSTMTCTLDERYLPPALPTDKPRPEQDHLLHVYATDRQGWRSFITANVIDIEPVAEA